MSRQPKFMSGMVAAVFLVAAVAPAAADTLSAGHRAGLSREVPQSSAWRTGAIVRDGAGKLVLDPKARVRRQPDVVKGGAAATWGGPSSVSGCALGGIGTARFDVPSSVDTIVRKLAPGLGLDPHLVFAVIKVESNFQPKAVSPKSAQGLMQLIPDTAARFGVRDPFDPTQNIRGGMAYLRWLLNTFNGNLDLALAGYNAGEKAVERHKGIPPYRETQDYVRKVLSLYGCGGGGFASAQPMLKETVQDGLRRGWHALGPESGQPVQNPYDLWSVARRSVAETSPCNTNRRRGWDAFPSAETVRCQ